MPDIEALIAEARRVVGAPTLKPKVPNLVLIERLADALEAATVAPAADRAKASMVLWEVLWPGTVDVMDHPELGAERFKVRQILDALTSSNVLRDVRDVQAEALEQAADVCERIQNDEGFGGSGAGRIAAAKIVLRSMAEEARND